MRRVNWFSPTLFFAGRKEKTTSGNDVLSLIWKQECLSPFFYAHVIERRINKNVIIDLIVRVHFRWGRKERTTMSSFDCLSLGHFPNGGGTQFQELGINTYISGKAHWITWVSRIAGWCMASFPSQVNGLQSRLHIYLRRCAFPLGSKNDYW